MLRRMTDADDPPGVPGVPVREVERIFLSTLRHERMQTYPGGKFTERGRGWPVGRWRNTGDQMTGKFQGRGTPGEELETIGMRARLDERETSEYETFVQAVVVRLAEVRWKAWPLIVKWARLIPAHLPPDLSPNPAFRHGFRSRW